MKSARLAQNRITFPLLAMVSLCVGCVSIDVLLKQNKLREADAHCRSRTGPEQRQCFGKIAQVFFQRGSFKRSAEYYQLAQDRPGLFKVAEKLVSQKTSGSIPSIRLKTSIALRLAGRYYRQAKRIKAGYPKIAIRLIELDLWAEAKKYYNVPGLSRKSLLLVADRLLDRKRLTEAERLYIKAGMKPGYLRLARAFITAEGFRPRKYQSATKYFRLAGRAKQGHVEMAEHFLAKKQHVEAAKYFKKAGMERQGYLKIAKVCLRAGYYTCADWAFTSAGQAKRGYLILGRAYLRDGNLQRAGKYFEKAGGDKPGYQSVARAFLARGDHTSAARYFESADEGAEARKCYLAMAKKRLSRGQLGEAARYFSRAGEADRAKTTYRQAALKAAKEGRLAARSKKNLDSARLYSRAASHFEMVDDRRKARKYSAAAAKEYSRVGRARAAKKAPERAAYFHKLAAEHYRRAGSARKAKAAYLAAAKGYLSEVKRLKGLIAKERKSALRSVDRYRTSVSKWSARMSLRTSISMMKAHRRSIVLSYRYAAQCYAEAGKKKQAARYLRQALKIVRR